MAALVAPDNVRRMHQSLHLSGGHSSVERPLDPEAGARLRISCDEDERCGPGVDRRRYLGFPRKGCIPWVWRALYCGQVGKQEKCRVAVSLSVSTNTASLPIVFRLFQHLHRRVVGSDHLRRQHELLQFPV